MQNQIRYTDTEGYTGYINNRNDYLILPFYFMQNNMKIVDVALDIYSYICFVCIYFI